jgi:hypothetical protein
MRQAPPEKMRQTERFAVPATGPNGTKVQYPRQNEFFSLLLSGSRSLPVPNRTPFKGGPPFLTISEV